MIIMSQDKTEIINFNNIESIWICSDEEGIFTIEATADTNTSLGEYKTEERAKEILIGIMASYQANKILECTYGSIAQNQIADKFLESGVLPFKYEMPKE